jgi:hypothetical protein
MRDASVDAKEDAGARIWNSMCSQGALSDAVGFRTMSFELTAVRSSGSLRSSRLDTPLLNSYRWAKRGNEVHDSARQS